MQPIVPTSSLALSRRDFFRQGALASAAMTAFGPLIVQGAENAPSRRIRAGVMGLGRGLALAQSALPIPGFELAAVCDVDQVRIDAALKTLAPKTTAAPQPYRDLRRMLEDRTLDAVFVAACNHWHAPATILACAAGKHVYVEKPASHNAREGEWMVAAARKYQRVVQQGMQRRNYPSIIEGIAQLREGAIGPVRFARCWYNNARGSIGRSRQIPVPSNLDFALWQGPAPERPYADNLVHYHWHWRWHWGNGELGNNGIHYLDLARWGLGVEYPRSITYTGGRYHFDDDQETPDTGVVTFDFGASGASWEHSSCQARKPETFPLVTFYGDRGSLSLEDNSYTICDPQGKASLHAKPSGNVRTHIADFLDCIRNGGRPQADIEEGQKSTLLCHLGNIAYRTGHTIHFDPATRKIVNDPAAQALWSREYRPGWQPRV